MSRTEKYLRAFDSLTGSKDSGTLFHLHTKFTDGRLSVEDYFIFARKHGLRRLVFLEHIRCNPTYDVYRFVDEVKQQSEKYGLEGVVGFEAKLLPQGELDIHDEHLEQAEFVGIAEHGFPGDAYRLRAAFSLVLERYLSTYARQRFVWVHPGLWYKRRGMLTHPAYGEMLEIAASSSCLLEFNVRYGLPNFEGQSDYLINRLGPRRVIIGIDAHTEQDLEMFLGNQVR